MAGKSIALLFFNPSLRTRTSFELGAWQLGGKAIVLSPGKDAWPLEFELGSVMDGDAEEHVKEAAQVLSRYCDLIAIRAFPEFKDWNVDRQDRVIHAFARIFDGARHQHGDDYAPVPGAGADAEYSSSISASRMAGSFC